MAVREVERQCTTLRASAEHNTSVRIAGECQLLSWLRRFAAQIMNNTAQFGEKVSFREIGEDGASSFASRVTPGIFVGHHDRTGAVLRMTKNGVKRDKCWTRQPLNDAWDAASWDGLCVTPWQMVALEMKLTKKVAFDKERAGLPLTRIAAERIPEVELRRSADIEARGHTGGFPGCATLPSLRRATNPHNKECRERIRTVIERTLTGKARIRMKAYKERERERERVAETEKVKERRRAQEE